MGLAPAGAVHRVHPPPGHHRLHRRDRHGDRDAADQGRLRPAAGARARAASSIAWRRCGRRAAPRSVAELAVAAATLALLSGVPRLTKRVPAPLLAHPAGGGAGGACSIIFSPGTRSRRSRRRFHAAMGGHVVDGVPPLPPLPMLPWHAPGPGGQPLALSLATVRELLSGAFAVAMLGGIESLLSAVIADGMAGTRHDPDAELLALGHRQHRDPVLRRHPRHRAPSRAPRPTSARARARRSRRWSTR